jgi:ribosomal protein S20
MSLSNLEKFDIARRFQQKIVLNDSFQTIGTIKEAIDEAISIEKDQHLKLLDEAMHIIDDYLNAGCYETRKAAHLKARALYQKHFKVAYKNRTER